MNVAQRVAYAETARPAKGYAVGQDVPKDYVQARVWWNLAAAQGDADAQKKPGYC